MLLLWIFFFAICVSYHTVLSVSCSLVVSCWDMTDPLALLFVMLSCSFVIFPYGVLGQVWYLIIWIPDICLLPYFNNLGSYAKLHGLPIWFIFNSCIQIYLKPKVTLHFELSNISLLFLSLTKLNIPMSCWFPPCPISRKTT